MRAVNDNRATWWVDRVLICLSRIGRKEERIQNETLILALTLIDCVTLNTSIPLSFFIYEISI